MSWRRANRERSKWAQLEALATTEDRLESRLAEDLVAHFDQARCESLDGKAMVVCMSRKACAALYDEDHRAAGRTGTSEDVTGEGALKVIMTAGASPIPADLQRPPYFGKSQKDHHRLPGCGTRTIELKMVLVRDMWLTGFDAPPLHTLYIDKPMKGANLMQAIARVNRVFRDKPSGLVVDYIGIAPQLKSAIGEYTRSAGKGQPVLDVDQAVLLVTGEGGNPAQDAARR